MAAGWLPVKVSMLCSANGCVVATLDGFQGLQMATRHDKHGWHDGMAASRAVLTVLWPEVAVLKGLRCANGEKRSLLLIKVRGGLSDV